MENTMINKYGETKELLLDDSEPNLYNQLWQTEQDKIDKLR